VLIAFIAMRMLGMNSNIMSLGGIAIAIGAMVDAGDRDDRERATSILSGLCIIKNASPLPRAGEVREEAER